MTNHAPDPIPAALGPFPPLGNPALCSIAVADVAHDPVFAQLRTAFESGARGRVGLDDRTDRWLGAAVRAANDRGFRFELRGLHAGGAATWVDLATDDRTQVGGVRMTEERGTTKLVVLLGLTGSGTATLQAPGLSTPSAVAAGQLAIWPAFLDVRIDLPPGERLGALATTAHGPAFR